jgi:hypothetical protein
VSIWTTIADTPYCEVCYVNGSYPPRILISADDWYIEFTVDELEKYIAQAKRMADEQR